MEKICQRLGIPNGHAGPGWLQSFQNPGPVRGGTSGRREDFVVLGTEAWKH